MSLPATLPLDEDQHQTTVGTNTAAAAVFELRHLTNPSLTRSFDPSTQLAIGRDANACNILVDSPMLSRVHCKVYSLGRDVLVQDWSSNGTFVGAHETTGRKIGKGGSKRLQSGDIVSLIHPSAPMAKQYQWSFQSLVDRLGAGSGNTQDASSSSSSPDADKKKKKNEHTIDAHYDLREVLGTGNFATVRLGISRGADRRRVAVKIVEKKRFAMGGSDFSFQALLNESEILRSMSHENIVKVFDVFDDDATFTMVLELVRGGDLFDYIVGRGVNPFPERDAKVLFVQLLEAMIYMYSRGIVHRDLKPENILVACDPEFFASLPPGASAQANAPRIPVGKVTLKVTDFGLAKFCKEHEVMTTMCGTPTYLAPEVLHKSQQQSGGGGGAGAGAGAKNGYTNAVDIWSLGVVLYILLSGTQPKGAHNGVQFTKYFNQTSSHALDLVTQMLAVDPRKRADLETICNHPWLQGVEIKGRERARRVSLEEAEKLKAEMTKTPSQFLAAGSSSLDSGSLPASLLTSSQPLAASSQQQQQQQQQQDASSSSANVLNIPQKPKNLTGAETDEDNSDTDDDQQQQKSGDNKSAGDRRQREEEAGKSGANNNNNNNNNDFLMPEGLVSPNKHNNNNQQQQPPQKASPAPTIQTINSGILDGSTPNVASRVRVEWRWKSDLDKSDNDATAWRPFSATDSAHIEHAYQKGRQTAKVPSVADLRVSFAGLFQFRVSDTGRQRAVKRVEIAEVQTN